MGTERPQSFRRLIQIAQNWSRRLVPGTIMGYDSGEPGGKAVQGDLDFPFFKDPPALEEVATYFVARLSGEINSTIPQATSYAQMRTLDTIDVRGFRSLTLFIEYISAGGANPTIGLVPQCPIVFEGRKQEPTWFNYGVVDPILRGTGFVVGSLETSLEARSTAYRDCYSAQLDFSFQQNEPRNVSMFFDVAPVDEIRFLIGSVARTSENSPARAIYANLYYQLGR